jgi:predicted TPR repeat methyltransferase
MPEQVLESAFNVTQPSATTATSGPAWEVGKALRLAGRLEEAVRVMRRASPDEQRDVRLHDELGTVLSELNRQEEAIGSFLTALRLAPDRGDLCNKLGEAFCSRGLYKPAVDWFDRGQQMDPTVSRHYYSHGRSLVAMGCIKLASEVFQQWIEAEPENPIAQHLAIATLGRQEADRASPEYVCKLFNDCADRFDGILARLQYCGPQILLAALQEIAGNPASGWDVLDVGCGTGLSGAALRPVARRLVGVDLSSGMLALARQRGVYDELVESDLIDYLTATSNRFDVVTASDVLTYLGDLSAFFQSATKVLHPGGLIAVAVEAFDGDAKGQTYRLNATGRFSHSAQYLRSQFKDVGLSIACLRDVVMREEGSRPVPSLVAVGRAPSG